MAKKAKKSRSPAAGSRRRPATSSHVSFPIVGIGASAGGLEAIEALLKGIPADTGVALVFIQHLDPKHESLLTEILARSTTMPVKEITDGMRVMPSHVYVIPPNTDLEIKQGVLRLHARTFTRGQHMPVDVFLRSLAEDQKNKAIGVILSGTASDGVLGLKAIKAEGGITFAQDEQSARYGGMPRNAMTAGVVDFVLPPESIARELERIGRHPYLASEQAAVPETLPPESRGSLTKIFTVLRQTFGTDFSDYKDTTIRRRIKRRMVLHKIEDPEAYLRYLRDSAEEVEALYHDILINVTSFLRDPVTFDALKAKVFPTLLENRQSDEPIRIWIPGCATGEEAYSVAICLLEFLSATDAATPIQIFGTDVSEVSIEKARAGAYLENITLDVSPERVRRFFTRTDGAYRISKMVRDLCIFAQHDVTKDPPFSRLDLITCRNLLIYLTPVLQQRILSRFHYALKPHGFVMLGSSETIGSFGHYFRLVDKKSKIYAKRITAGRPRLEFPLTKIGTDRFGISDKKPALEGKPEFDALKEADRIVQSQYAPSGVLINDEMEVLQFRGRTSNYLEPSPGTASLNLMKMAREGLLPELRASIQQARRNNAPVSKEEVRVRSNGQTKIINLKVFPIRGNHGAEPYFLVLFEQPPQSEAPSRKRTGSAKERASDLRGKDRELLNLRRELEATKDYLQSIVEEQEATNEELKSANEEILSSNEELQSTNEELETAKEELQSGNEELTTLNEELQNRNIEIGQVNNDLLNLLSSISIPLVMLATDLRIRRFTPQAEKVLNLIPSDVGRPLTDIRLNMHIPDLEERILRVIDTVSGDQVEVQDKEGRWHSLWIRPYKTSENKIDGAILILVDIDPLKRHAAEITTSKSQLEAEVLGHERAEQELRRLKFISDHSADGQELIDQEGRFLFVNRRASERLGYTEAEMLQLNVADIEPTLTPDKIQDLFGRVQNERVPPFESVRRRKDGSAFPVEVSVTPVTFDDEPYLFVIARNITDRKKAERRTQLAVEAAPNAMVMTSEKGIVFLVNAQAERLLGYPREDLIGKSIHLLFPPRYRSGPEAFLADFLAHPTQQPAGRSHRVTALRKDGEEVPVEVRLNSIETDEGIWMLAAIVDITERMQAEESLHKVREELEVRVRERTAALNQALEELQTEFEQRRQLTAQMIRIQDEERRRLARELHDSTGQNLVALKLDLTILQEKAASLDQSLREVLTECMELAEKCIKEVRTLSYVLHPPLLDERGLASALRLFSEGFSQRSGIDLTLDFPEDLGPLPPEVELAGFRIVQECLTNVHRHADSKTAKVHLERQDHQMLFEVSDAGRGFKATDGDHAGKVVDHGIGIRGMRERIRQLGGSLQIDSGPGGTRVRAILPLGEAAS